MYEIADGLRTNAMKKIYCLTFIRFSLSQHFTALAFKQIFIYTCVSSLLPLCRNKRKNMGKFIPRAFKK